jgi:hypothetical protein
MPPIFAPAAASMTTTDALVLDGAQTPITQTGNHHER